MSQYLKKKMAVTVLVIGLLTLAFGSLYADTMTGSPNEGLRFAFDHNIVYVQNTTGNSDSEQVVVNFFLTFGYNGLAIPDPEEILTNMICEFTFNADSLELIDAAALNWSGTFEVAELSAGYIKLSFLNGTEAPPVNDEDFPFAQLTFTAPCQPEGTLDSIKFFQENCMAQLGTVMYEPAVPELLVNGYVQIAEYTAEFTIQSDTLTDAYGSIFDVPVSGTTNFRIYVMEHWITYDDTKLEFLGVFEPYEPAIFQSSPPGSNPIHCLLAGTGLGDVPPIAPLDNVPVYKLRFRVKSEPLWDGSATTVSFDPVNSTLHPYDGLFSTCDVLLTGDPPVTYTDGEITLERYAVELQGIFDSSSFFIGGTNKVWYSILMKNRFTTGMPIIDPQYRGNITVNLDKDPSLYLYRVRERHPDLTFSNSETPSGMALASTTSDYMLSFWQIDSSIVSNQLPPQEDFTKILHLELDYTGLAPSSYANRFVPLNFTSANPFSTYGHTTRMADVDGLVTADSANGRVTWQAQQIELPMGEWYGSGGWSKFEPEVHGYIKMRHDVPIKDFNIFLQTGPEFYISSIQPATNVMVQFEICAPGYTCRTLMSRSGVVWEPTGDNWRTIAEVTYKLRSGCTAGTRVTGTVSFSDRTMIAMNDQFLHTVGNYSANLSALCPGGGGGDTILPPIYDNLDKPDQAQTLPTQYALHANYPNPFNPSTQIDFDLPQSGHVRIDVYNIAGQHVKTLVDRDMSAGFHSVEWAGVDAGGSPVASGVYLYRLTVNDFAESRKMILLK